MNKLRKIAAYILVGDTDNKTYSILDVGNFLGQKYRGSWVTIFLRVIKKCSYLIIQITPNQCKMKFCYVLQTNNFSSKSFNIKRSLSPAFLTYKVTEVKRGREGRKALTIVKWSGITRKHLTHTHSWLLMFFHNLSVGFLGSAVHTYLESDHCSYLPCYCPGLNHHHVLSGLLQLTFNGLPAPNLTH